MSKKRNNSFGNMQFKSIVLSDQRKHEFETQSVNSGWDWADYLMSFADHNCKFSYSYDNQQEAHLISITPKSVPKGQEKTCFMFRHRDLLKAISISWFYFELVIDWGAIPEDTDSDLDW